MSSYLTERLITVLYMIAPIGVMKLASDEWIKGQNQHDHTVLQRASDCITFNKKEKYQS